MTVKKKVVLADGTSHFRAEPYKAEAQEQFIEWLALPRSERQPPTYAALAEELGVSVASLYNWKKDPHVTDQVRARMRSVLGVEKLPDVIGQLYRVATGDGYKGSENVSAARTLLDWFERAAPPDSSHAPLSELSLKDLKQLAADLHDEVDERMPKAVDG